jgi:isochorismate synthase
MSDREVQASGAQKYLSQGLSFFLFSFPGEEVDLALPRSDGEMQVVGRDEADGVRFSTSGEAGLKAGAPELPEETSFEAYARAFHHYLEAFKSGKVSKAILSRIIRASLPSGFCPVDYFQALRRSYPHAFTYLLNHPYAGLWCGASPELLLRGNESTFETTSLAGTQKINRDGRYHWGEKEREEQAMVSQHIRDTLKDVGAKDLRESEVYTSVAGNVAHPKTDFSFTFRKAPSEVAGALHPTPAVEGLPVGASKELIDRCEGHERGLYTGFLGRLDERSAQLYVNLRCMQIGAEEAAIYVGGGITAASRLEAEWEETRLKAKTLLNLFKLPK